MEQHTLDAVVVEKIINNLPIKANNIEWKGFDESLVKDILEMHLQGKDYSELMEYLYRKGLRGGQLFFHMRAAFNLPLFDAQLVFTEWHPQMSDIETAEYNKMVQNIMVELIGEWKLSGVPLPI